MRLQPGAGFDITEAGFTLGIKGTVKDTPTLARELNVTHVVTGAVRRMGNALRITAELVDASTDTSIWSRKFSGSMDDVFGFQEDISRQIVAALDRTGGQMTEAARLLKVSRTTLWERMQKFGL